MSDGKVRHRRFAPEMLECQIIYHKNNNGNNINRMGTESL